MSLGQGKSSSYQKTPDDYHVRNSKYLYQWSLEDDAGGDVKVNTHRETFKAMFPQV